MGFLVYIILTVFVQQQSAVKLHTVLILSKGLDLLAVQSVRVGLVYLVFLCYMNSKLKYNFQSKEGCYT